MPKLKDMKKAIKYMQDKEIVIFKIILDIIGSYLRVFYGSNSSVYV
jgi:hypothetical protein